MSELRDILAAYARLCARGEWGVLASVVHARGSTYRRAGARLLLLPDDSMLGLIGGGCLEGDLLLRAQEVRASGAPLLLRYDASATGDVLWGLGFGCAGVVEVLLERVGADAPGPLDALARWRKTREHGALATVISGPRIGAHSALGEHDARASGLRDPELENALREVLEARGVARALHVERAGERAVVENFAPPLRLLIFGAGPDAAPLAQRALELGWEVEVFDPRQAHAQAARFPGARVHCCETGHAIARAAPGEDAYCVLMTHHYERDRVLLRDALKTRAPYIALLGPRARCDDLLADLQSAGEPAPAHAAPSSHATQTHAHAARAKTPEHHAAHAAPSSRAAQTHAHAACAKTPEHHAAHAAPSSHATQMHAHAAPSSRAACATATHARDLVRARIFAPAGLDLGADAPEEIALAIVAEVLAVSKARAGASLRERNGPIHDDPERA